MRYAFFLVLALPLGATQQAPAQRATGTLTEGVNAVVVDVVVRDRRGEPVRDLAQSEFEVLEDGVPQKIGAFTPVFEGGGLREPTRAAPAAPGVPGAAVAAPPVSGGPIVMALVFDRLSPEGRRLAIQASQSYLGTQAETPSYIGVFGVDLALTPYAPFTRNARVVRQALDRMASRGSSSFNSPEQRQQRTSADQQAAMAGQAAAAAPGPPPAARPAKRCSARSSRG